MTEKLTIVNGNDFLNNRFMKREFIIEPFFMTQGLMMIYAQRGIGKTYFAMTLAAAMIQGISLFDNRFKISRKQKVLYIDGEMSGHDMQERFKSLSIPKENLDNIRIFNPDLQAPLGVSPNLASTEGQELINEDGQWADVIIVDNLSTLARDVSENQSNSWDIVQSWALKLRSQGKSIIFIHHAGKNNTQRGTSRREDVLDTVIKLRRPAEYNSKEGARFEIHFEKSRGFVGEDAESFEVKLELNNGKTIWICDKINSQESRRAEEIMQLYEDGISQRKIAEIVGTSLSKVNRVIQNNK